MYTGCIEGWGLGYVFEYALKYAKFLTNTVVILRLTTVEGITMHSSNYAGFRGRSPRYVFLVLLLSYICGLGVFIFRS